MSAERSKAQRAAEARYDQKRRGVTITLRLSSEQAKWLDARSKDGESRPAALRRLAKMPDMPPNKRYTDEQGDNASVMIALLLDARLTSVIRTNRAITPYATVNLIELEHAAPIRRNPETTRRTRR